MVPGSDWCRVVGTRVADQVQDGRCVVISVLASYCLSSPSGTDSYLEGCTEKDQSKRCWRDPNP